MLLKDKLPVSYLLFTKRGRINRLTYWTASIFIWTSFYILFYLLHFINYSATWLPYPFLFWALLCTAIKRLHDMGKNGYWLMCILIPVIGPLYLIYILGFKKSMQRYNKFGKQPGTARDYFKNGKLIKIENNKTAERIVNDVTQINPIIVAKVEIPKSIDELIKIIKNSETPISVGGGRFSMGGQTASNGSTHIDMRQLNKIISFSEVDKLITVEAGTRWCDIQHYIDKYNLSIKIMQTYANFTVGGALNVNCHGRYIGLGAVILSVKCIEVILANGDLLKCSPTENNDIFFASIGCYNAISIIATVQLELSENVKVKRHFVTLKTLDYKDFFFKNVRENNEIIFHNADLYPPQFKNARAVSWITTNDKPTEKTRLMPLADAYPIERYFIHAFSRSDFGKWRRAHIIDPLLYKSKKVHWRNYEAGYDVAELEPESRKKSTYVLQEYFIPVQKFDNFSIAMAEIFNRYKVNVINVSIRHAQKDIGSLLAWAKEEMFAFVVWYKQGIDEVAKNKVAVWTRELIDAALQQNGSYYLPYQVHATKVQFHNAYPNAMKLFELKQALDPTFKFRNIIWNTYYK